MPPPPESVTLTLAAAPLADYCVRLLAAVGTPEPYARIVADSLVAANLRGVDSHGVQMLATYLQQIRAGGLDPRAEGHVIREDGVCLHYDGGNGLGQVVSDRCTTHALRVARALGVAVVVARNSNHFGAGAWWGEKLAGAGFIGIVMSNACPAVAPWQGATAVLGTNPLCVAVPGRDGRARWMLDMATTTVALGKLGHANQLNRKTIPAAWGFLDASGQPTTDTAKALAGAPTPIGGYKGTGLAMMVEILCAGLSGGAMTTELPVYRTGGDPLGISHTFIAIDPARFLPPGEFASRMDRLVGLVKATPPAAGFSEVLVAGEPEWRSEENRRREGIPVPRKLWASLGQVAAELKVVPPPADDAARN